MDKKILVIEDSEVYYLLAESYLLNYAPAENIYHSATLAEGLKVLSANTPDVIILDLNLPDSHGLETIKKVAGNNAEIPIVVLTSNNDMEFGKTTLSLGASDYLTKGQITGESLWKSITYAIERKKNDKIIKEYSEFYRVLFQNNQTITLLIDPQTGNIVDANNSACKFYGYTPEEIRRKKIFDINADSNKEISQKMELALNKHLNRFQFSHRLSNNEIRDVEVSSEPIFINGKKLLYAVVVDVTERNKIREELSSRNNKRFLANQLLSKFIKLAVTNRKISELIEIVIKEAARVLKIDYLRICFVNDKMCSHNCAAEINDNQTCALEEFDKIGGEHLSSGKSIVINDFNEVNSAFGIFKEYFQPGDFGSMMIVPLMVEKKYMGAIICGSKKLRKWWAEEESFFASVADIIAIASENEIHAAEEEKLNLKIKKSRKELEELNKLLYELLEVQNVILDGIPDLAWMKDCNGRFKAVNKIFSSKCGIPKEKIINKTDFDIWDHKSAQVYCENDLMVINSKKELKTEEWIKDENGTSRLYETVKVPIFSKGGMVSGTVGISHDITLLKQASEVLEHENRKLEKIVSGRTKDLEIVENSLRKEMHEKTIVEDQLMKLSVAVEQSPVSILITDIKGNIEYVNPKFCETSGYTREEVIGENTRILKSGNTSEETYRDMWGKLSEGNVWTGELLNRKKNNELHWERSVISPIRNNSGIITNYIGIEKDITEEKNAEIILRESEERFKLLYEKAPVGYLSLDISGNIIDVNNIWLQKLGYSAEEVKGKWFGNFLHGNYQGSFTSGYQQFLKKGEISDIELEILTKEGKIIVAQFTGRVAHDSRGNFIQTHFVFLDVTERRKMEKKIAESEERFRTIFENSPVGIRISINGITQIINQSFVTMFGYSDPSELIGSSILDGVAPSSRTKVINFLVSKAKEEQTEDNFIYYCLKKDGTEFPINVSVAELMLPEGRALVGFYADITDQKLKENQIISSLKEKEILIKEIHHRVKNNLQIISSLLNLQTDNITDPVLLEAFNVSRNRVKAMALIHEKLYHSKDLSVIDINEYISALIIHLQRTYATNGRKVEFNISMDSIYLSIDTAIPCGLIVNELVSNALKYAFVNKNSGVLTISVKQNEEGFVSLEIADDGIGLPPEFDINSAATLGLQLVFNLADQIGGKVEIKKDNGVKFIIKFRI